MTISQKGDLWIVGPHRVLCGDCTRFESVDRLMGGLLAAQLITSPPYDQQRTYISGIADWDDLMRGAFRHLPVVEDGQLFVNLGCIRRGGEMVEYWDTWLRWMKEMRWKWADQYVWDKGWGDPGDHKGRLAPCHELIFHFNRNPRRPYKTVAKKLSSIGPRNYRPGFRTKDGTRQLSPVNPQTFCGSHKIPDSVIRVHRAAGPSKHPARYPAELPEVFIRAFSDPGNIIFDPFLGSGTTTVAADRAGRRCFGMEIEPEYCDIALERLMYELKIVPYRAGDFSRFGNNSRQHVLASASRDLTSNAALPLAA